MIEVKLSDTFRKPDDFSSDRKNSFACNFIHSLSLSKFIAPATKKVVPDITNQLCFLPKFFTLTPLTSEEEQKKI